MLKLRRLFFLLFPLIHFELTPLSPGYLLMLSHHVLCGSRWSRFISVIWWSGVTDGEFPCRVSWGRWWASWGNTSATWRETSWTSTNQSSPPSSSPRWTSVLNTARWVHSCSGIEGVSNMSDVFSSSVKEWTDCRRNSLLLLVFRAIWRRRRRSRALWSTVCSPWWWNCQRSRSDRSSSR